MVVKANGQESVPAWNDLIGKSVLAEYEMQFVVNFSYGESILYQIVSDMKICFF